LKSGWPWVDLCCAYFCIERGDHAIAIGPANFTAASDIDQLECGSQKSGTYGGMGSHFDGHESAGFVLAAHRHGRSGTAVGSRQLACLQRSGRRESIAKSRRPINDQHKIGSSLMWGYSEDQIASFGLTFGVGAFMLYMLFIIGHLAWESKAGKFGTFVLFLGLAFGMVGFVAKMAIQFSCTCRR